VTPPREQALMHQLATQVHGPDWRPATGIVLRSGRERLRAGAARLDPGRQDSPELEFFARSNPGHADGDMLACLCALTAANWISAGMRAVVRAMRRKPLNPGTA
jgi:hypothetical protein